MNPEQQRIAIAEAVGKDADYLNDLNAMHEAEKVLAQRTREYLGSYQLYCRVLLDFFGSGVSYKASQRAEAFLRTIGKWEEGK